MGYICLMIAMFLLVFGVRISHFWDREGETIEVFEAENAKAIRSRAEFAGDTLHINTASVSQLFYFGFSNYAIRQIMMFREAGGGFKNVTQLRSFCRTADTLLIDAKYADGLLLFDMRRDASAYAKQREQRVWKENYSYEKKQWSKSPSKNYVERAAEKSSKRVSLYYADSAELVADGVLPEVCAALSELKSRYVVRGSTTLDTLLMADAETLEELLAEHLTSKKSQVQQAQEKKKVELNTATRAELVAVRGIGDYTAQMILQRREECGGFVDVLQLLYAEVVPSKNYELIETQVYVDKSKVKRLKVNALDARKLSKHPFVDEHVAKALYRRRVGKKPLTEADFDAVCKELKVSKFTRDYLDFSVE